MPNYKQEQVSGHVLSMNLVALQQEKVFCNIYKKYPFGAGWLKRGTQGSKKNLKKKKRGAKSPLMRCGKICTQKA